MPSNNVLGIAKNVLGSPLELCCNDPVTGFFRDGFCNTNQQDIGKHWVCAVMTEEFLRFSQQQGNDLITPRLEFQFPGLKPGDGWCLCALRWLEAYEAGVAPKVKLASTHERALEVISLDQLKEHGLS